MVNLAKRSYREHSGVSCIWPLMYCRVCLLVVLGTWTVLALRLLVQAQTLEHAVQTNVQYLHAQLVSLDCGSRYTLLLNMLNLQ